MLNINLSPLNLTLSAAVVVGLVHLNSTETGVTASKQVVLLNTDVNQVSSEDTAKKLDDLEKRTGKPILLHISSPGGEVLSGREVVEEIRTSKVDVNTLVTNYAMSMGMDFFLTGDKRFATADALGMIHRGSAGNMTFGALKDALAVLELEKQLIDGGMPTSPQRRLEVEAMVEQLRSTVQVMDKLFEPTFRTLNKLLETAPNKEKLKALIEELKVGKTDIYLTAQEMLEVGIVTQIVSSKEEAEAITNAGR